VAVWEMFNVRLETSRSSASGGDSDPIEADEMAVSEARYLWAWESLPYPRAMVLHTNNLFVLVLAAWRSREDNSREWPSLDPIGCAERGRHSSVIPQLTT
jgi:hypothetical protein